MKTKRDSIEELALNQNSKHHVNYIQHVTNVGNHYLLVLNTSTNFQVTL